MDGLASGPGKAFGTLDLPNRWNVRDRWGRYQHNPLGGQVRVKGLLNQPSGLGLGRCHDLPMTFPLRPCLAQ